MPVPSGVVVVNCPLGSVKGGPGAPIEHALQYPVAYHNVGLADAGTGEAGWRRMVADASLRGPRVPVFQRTAALYRPPPLVNDDSKQWFSPVKPS